MKDHRFSWYLGTEHPKRLLIGPKGHDCKEWRELDPVATPPDWWRNGFYMDAEARCVLRRHDLEMHFDSQNAKKEREKIFYANINYTVPGHEHSDATKHQIKQV